MTERLVWFLLVDREGVAYKETSADCVNLPFKCVISQFRDAVRNKYVDSHLEGIAPSDLLVYADKKAFDANTVDAPTNLRSSRLLEVGDGRENEDDGLGPDKDHALFVEQADMNPSYFIKPNVQGNVKNSIFCIMDTANVNNKRQQCNWNGCFFS